jgi:hypothetical protein
MDKFATSAFNPHGACTFGIRLSNSIYSAERFAFIMSGAFAQRMESTINVQNLRDMLSSDVVGNQLPA